MQGTKNATTCADSHWRKAATRGRQAHYLALKNPRGDTDNFTLIGIEAQVILPILNAS